MAGKSLIVCLVIFGVVFKLCIEESGAKLDLFKGIGVAGVIIVVI